MTARDLHQHECERCGRRWWHWRSRVKELRRNLESHTCPECLTLIQTGPEDVPSGDPLLLEAPYYGLSLTST